MKCLKKTVRHYWKGVEYKTAGTYSKTLTAGRYTIIAVGGGSGGTYNLDNSGDHMEKQGSASGGSGAYLEMVVDLQDGNYEIVVGAGGARNGGFHDGSAFPSGAGGDTYISLNGTNIFKSGGGTSATALYASSFRGSAGQGGTNTLPTDYIEIINNVNGNSGGTKAAYSYFDGGASVYEGYGAGGFSQSDWRYGNSSAGTGGYIKMVAEGTADDYDYYTEEEIVMLPKKIVRHYWKYIYESWTQPILTSNGTMGGTEFAMNQSSTYSSYYAYKSLSGSGSLWHSGQAIPAWCAWYNPIKLRIDRLDFGVGQNSANPDMPRNYAIQGSDDGTNWTDVYSGTNSSTSPIPLPISIDLTNIQNREYKYWRYYISSVLGRSYGNMRNLVITAQTKTKLVKSTADDYDFFTDDETYFGINQ